MLLTLCGQQVSADKRCVHILQKYDALLRRDAEQMVETIVWKWAVAQTHQTDAVAELTSQRRAERSEKNQNQSNKCSHISGREGWADALTTAIV